MSEAMATETVVEAEWLLKGFWTKVRYPFQTNKGGWSDIDVLAYHTETKHLVISESKVRGQKNAVYSYTKYTKDEYGDIFDYDTAKYLSFIDNLPLFAQNGEIFDDFPKHVKRITMQLVSNYMVTEDVKSGVIKAITKKIKKQMKNNVSVEFLMDTTVDVFARVIELQHKSKQGRRYGNPIIDLARELNRYIHPSVKYAGRKKEQRENVRQQSLKALSTALGAKFI